MEFVSSFIAVQLLISVRYACVKNTKIGRKRADFKHRAVCVGTRVALELHSWCMATTLPRRWCVVFWVICISIPPESPVTSASTSTLQTDTLGFVTLFFLSGLSDLLYLHVFLKKTFKYSRYSFILFYRIFVVYCMHLESVHDRTPTGVSVLPHYHIYNYPQIPKTLNLFRQLDAFYAKAY